MNSQNPVTASIRISATPAAVFPYFTEAPLLRKWLGAWVQVNPEPNGEFAVDIGEQPIRGEYRVVEPPHRVVFSWGLPGNETLPPGASTVEVLLTAEGTDTIVELIHRDLPEVMRPDHLSGWTALLDGLSTIAG
jgi:uncharacterized protein YndB with AHSA1/START domain